MKAMEEKLVELKELLETQGNDGNWNSNEYMRGLYNGMELSVAIIEEREPIYRESPKKDITVD